MSIVYLMDQYPVASCTFIRREIKGLESHGVKITRIAIRRLKSSLVDWQDKLEFNKTKVILAEKLGVLLGHSLVLALSKPFFFLKALILAFKIGWKSDAGLKTNLAYLMEACILFRWCQDLKVTHVHAHFGTDAAAVAMLCHSLGGPAYSFTVHGPEEFEKAKMISLYEKIKRSVFVVAISQFCKNELLSLSGDEFLEKIKIIRVGLDKEYLDHPYVPIPSKSQFLAVGRLVPQKGWVILIKAVSKLFEQGIDFKLVIVGEGPLRVGLEELVSKEKLNGHVEFTGWLDDEQVRKQILSSQFMILTSLAEGLPNVLVESLALNRPVIATSIAGIPELIEHEKNGWLIVPASVDSLVDVLQIALKTPITQLEKMGKLGAAKVRERHDVYVESAELLKLFKQYN